MRTGQHSKRFEEDPPTNKEINVYITRMLPQECTERQYLDKLQEKEKQMKEGDLLSERPLDTKLFSQRQVPRAQNCKCCRCELDWSTGRTFCRFCGGYACGDCQPKKRSVRTASEPISICLLCELRYLLQLSSQVLSLSIQRYLRKHSIANSAFTRLADEQNKLESLFDYEKRKRQSINGETVEPISEISAEEKLRQQLRNTANEVSQLTEKIKRAKELNAKLRERLLSKSSKRKEAARSMSQNPIGQEQQVDAPVPHEMEASHSVEQEVNESFIGSILEQNIQESSRIVEEEEYKHRCHCSLM